MYKIRWKWGCRLRYVGLQRSRAPCCLTDPQTDGTKWVLLISSLQRGLRLPSSPLKDGERIILCDISLKARRRAAEHAGRKWRTRGQEAHGDTICCWATMQQQKESAAQTVWTVWWRYNVLKEAAKQLYIYKDRQTNTNEIVKLHIKNMS